MPFILLGAGIGALVGAVISTTEYGKEIDGELEKGFEKWKDVEKTVFGNRQNRRLEWW